MIVSTREGDPERLAAGLASHGSRPNPWPTVSFLVGRKKWEEEEIEGRRRNKGENQLLQGVMFFFFFFLFM
jgi:hypothetical protein